MSLRNDFNYRSISSLSNTLQIVTALENTSQASAAVTPVKVKLKDALQSTYERMARRYLELTFEVQEAMALYAFAVHGEFGKSQENLEKASAERDRYLSKTKPSILGDLIRNRPDATRRMFVDSIKMLTKELVDKARLNKKVLDTIEKCAAQMLSSQTETHSINPNELLYVLQEAIENIPIVYTTSSSIEASIIQHLNDKPAVHVHRPG